MAVRPGCKYEAEVVQADLITSTNSGTPGVWLVFQTDDGQIEHTLWISNKSRQSVIANLKKLGMSDAEIASQAGLSNVGAILAGNGKRVEIITFEEEYKGKKRTKVQWINEIKAKPSPGASPARLAAAILGGKQPVTQSASNKDISDDDIPF